MQLELEGCELPQTFEVETPSGGKHIYYRTPKALRQGVDVLGSGHDIRSLGGYVIGPKSVINGREYRISHTAHIAPAPQWLIEKLGVAREQKQTEPKTLSNIESSRASQRAQAWLLNAPIAIEGRGGDAETYKVAAHLKDLGCSADQAIDLLLPLERAMPSSLEFR